MTALSSNMFANNRLSQWLAIVSVLMLALLGPSTGSLFSPFSSWTAACASASASNASASSGCSKAAAQAATATILDYAYGQLMPGTVSSTALSGGSTHTRSLPDFAAVVGGPLRLPRPICKPSPRAKCADRHGRATAAVPWMPRRKHASGPSLARTHVRCSSGGVRALLHSRWLLCLHAGHHCRHGRSDACMWAVPQRTGAGHGRGGHAPHRRCRCAGLMGTCPCV